ncbi:MAG: hypothetical protein ACK4HE_06855 [Chitinophagaceae bacterium]
MKKIDFSGAIWPILILSLFLSPYFFIAFPLYIIVVVGFGITFFDIIRDVNYKKGFTQFTKLLLLIFQLILIVGFSYIVLKYSKALNLDSLRSLK